MHCNVAAELLDGRADGERVIEPTCHVAVMEQEVVQYLRAEQGGLFLDCTLGGGGHTAAILKANDSNRVFSFDRDSAAIAHADEKFAAESDRVHFEQRAFSNLSECLMGQTFDGIIADLGVSTDQLRSGRGFSFTDSAPLDMRMDQTSPLSAQVLINESCERELYQILKQGGVGREARAVATAIVRSRPIKDTAELSQIVARAAASLTVKKKIHPATVVFQAIRMAVNRELEELGSLLDLVPQIVKGGSRLAVLTFHSIEDQVVTAKLRRWAGSYAAPANWRGTTNEVLLGKLVEKRAVRPSSEEIIANPAARSARLRVFEFI